MNQQIRSILIEQARKGQPIAYGDLGLPHDNIVDRNLLSKVLYEISKFEHDHHRPLLSAMAMYAGFKDHGPGFYELAEQFGFGSKKKLTSDLFAFTQMNACKDFWQNDDNYRLYKDVNQPLPVYNFPFFTTDEITFLHTWGGRVYHKTDEQHLAAKNFIMSGPGRKTVYWSDNLVKLLPGFETFNWRMWSQKGWEDTPEGKIRVARFKTYTWARIYRKGDAYKDIFFTIGVDGNKQELVYKLDYYFEGNSKLSVAQKDLINKNIPKELRWKSIPMIDLPDFDWNKLMEISRTFIAENVHVYDKLIALAWGDLKPEEAFNNLLRKKEKPAGGVDHLPPINPSFMGTEIDFADQAIELKEIGNAGEELVKQHEKNWLTAIGKQELADQVEIVLDGMGYDIKSFTAGGDPKYIEVKTTTGNELMPFHYTINEYLYAERHPGNYLIYRLYNFDDETNTADFYIIEEPFKDLLFQPVVYKAYYRKVNARQTETVIL